MTEPGAPQPGDQPAYGQAPTPAYGQAPPPAYGAAPPPAAPYAPGEFAPGQYAPPPQHDQLARVVQAEAQASSMRKDSTVAYLLWFFLGGLGVHRFYLGKIGSGVAMLLLSVLSWMLTIILIGFVGIFAWFVWWVVDAILIPGWVRTYNDQVRRAAYGAQ